MSRSRRSHSSRPEGPSQRQLRVGEVIRHALADVFTRDDLQDPDLHGKRLTVSEVRVSADLKHASVFVMRLGGGDMEGPMRGLKRSRGYLRNQIARALTTKFTPDLNFIVDTSYDTASHIVDVLKSEEVARDLSSAKNEEGEGDGTP